MRQLVSWGPHSLVDQMGGVLTSSGCLPRVKSTSTWAWRAMPPLSVFVSYRRNPDAAEATLVDKTITSTFASEGKERVSVFRDTRQRLGNEWPSEVEKAVTSSDLLVALIGPDWLSTLDRYGRRRIDDPNDWVRRELELAFEADVDVIPIAFGGAEVPRPVALPPSIAQISERQGLVVRGEYWDDDLQPLLRELEVRLGEPARAVEQEPTGSRRLPYPDPPLPVPPAPLQPDEMAVALEAMLPGWSIERAPLPEDQTVTREELYREFHFESFPDVLDFMHEVGQFAQNANHHPRWENVYRTLYVSLSTWDIGHRVSHLDLQLAHHFDRVWTRYRSQG